MKILDYNGSLPVGRCFDCGITFCVDTPFKDIYVRESRNFKRTEDGFMLLCDVTRTYYVNCPVCGQELELPDDLIPAKTKENLKPSSNT